MKKFKLSFERLSQFLWGAALLAIPVTSFRWMPFLNDSKTFVRPLAMIPLAVLVPLLLIQAWRQRGQKMILTWPGVFVAFGIFLLYVIASVSLGALTNPIPLYNQEYFVRSIRALVTLFIGVVFFVTAVWMNRNEDDLRFSIKWLFVGFCLHIVWSGLQILSFKTNLLDREMIAHWQLSFSMREPVKNRISGLTYEPAWLAGQLATIYIPFLFSSVMTNFRLTRHRWLEPLLLALSLLTLLATYSRGGLLTTFAAMGVTFLLLGQEVLRAIWIWFINGFRSRVVDMFIRLGMVAVIVGILVGSFLFLSQMAIVRKLWQINADSLSEYMVDIYIGARGAYSAGAWAVYEEYPVTGSGLGTSGFYIYHNMPDWSLTTVSEIAKQMSPTNRLFPVPKNIYIRLFAETGLIGFILYLAFQFHVLGDILSLQLQNLPWMRFAAMAGMFAWFAVTFYNFTQDSLASPNIWLVSGIMVGLSVNSSQKVSLEKN